eukprot:ANDGO_06874.mRNA.1 hypothetical protein
MSDLTIEQLKQQAEAKGLKTSGNKEDLINRLDGPRFADLKIRRGFCPGTYNGNDVLARDQGAVGYVFYYAKGSSTSPKLYFSKNVTMQPVSAAKRRKTRHTSPGSGSSVSVVVEPSSPTSVDSENAVLHDQTLPTKPSEDLLHSQDGQHSSLSAKPELTFSSPVPFVRDVENTLMIHDNSIPLSERQASSPFSDQSFEGRCAFVRSLCDVFRQSLTKSQFNSFKGKWVAHRNSTVLGQGDTFVEAMSIVCQQLDVKELPDDVLISHIGASTSEVMVTAPFRFRQSDARPFLRVEYVKPGVTQAESGLSIFDTGSQLTAAVPPSEARRLQFVPQGDVIDVLTVVDQQTRMLVGRMDVSVVGDHGSRYLVSRDMCMYPFEMTSTIGMGCFLNGQLRLHIEVATFQDAGRVGRLDHMNTSTGVGQ